jgi:hypothetical protein
MNQHELAGTSMHQIGGWRFDFEFLRTDSRSLLAYSADSCQLSLRKRRTC